MSRGLRAAPRAARPHAAALAALAALALAGAAHAAPRPVEPAEKAPTRRSGTVHVARVAGSINPATSDYLQKSILRSEQENAALLVIELDTPGGLVSSTKDVIQAMLNARVPVAVYVSPQGAWAGSAGTFITMAAHVAAMAPGSSIGAAHPVELGGGGGDGKDDIAAQKAENLLAAFIESIAKQRERNVEWAVKAVRESVAVTADEALRLHVIDLVAADRGELLRQIDGRVVKLGGARVVLDVASAPQEELPMPLLTRLLSVIVSPDVAVILMAIAALGLFVEFNHPGAVLPGAVGGACLLLWLVAMQILPFSWLGLMLMAGGIALLFAEIYVSSFGLLFVAGLVCLLIGGSLIFDRPESSDLNVDFWSVLVPAVAGLGAFGLLVAFTVGRSLQRPQTAGVGELLGMIGTAKTAVGASGTVFVRGEYWRAHADEPLAERERVQVVGVEGLELTVRRAPPQA